MSKRGRIPKQAELKTGHRDNNIQVLHGGAEFTKPKPKAQWLLIPGAIGLTIGIVS